MQTAGQKRVRAGPTPEEEDFQQHRVLQSWFRLMRRFLLALMPLQQMLERFMDHMLSTKPHREALKEMIRSLPDEDLPMIQNVARQEMNRREDTGHRPQADGYWSNLSETSTHPARRPRPPPDPVLTERCRQINSLPGIEMILEPRPRCQCALQCKIHLSDSGPTGHNYKKLYFRCPLEQGHQCRFVKWCDQQPLLSLESWRHRQQPGDEPVSYAQILEAMIQTKCQHKETHRKGSNAFLTKVTCRICNKVIKVREDRKDGGDQVQGQHDILKLGTTLSSGNPLTSDSSDHLGRHRPGAPDRLSGISRISPLEEPTAASEPGGPMKQVTPKLERKLRAAIKKATAFWRELQLLLADMPLQCWAQVYPEKLRAAILKAYSQSINVAHVETVSSESMLAENHRLNYIIDTEFRALKSLQPEVPVGLTECQDPDSRVPDGPDSRLPEVPAYDTAEIFAHGEDQETHEPNGSGDQEDDLEPPHEREDEEGEAQEAPHQRGITERHGKTFKYLLQKTMDTFSCANMKEWEKMVDITMMTKNRMMNVGGFSPSQRVLGFNPFLPGGLLSGDDGHRGQQPEAKVGDLSVERAMKLRKAAAHAFIEADASNSLRRAVASGPRPILEYDIGEIVYFFRMGADKKLKFKPCYWHGPARIIMIDQPSTMWLSYQSQLVKASPERIRRASLEENMALSGWLEDLVQLKKDIVTEPIRGFLDLSDQPLPEILDDEANNEEYTPTEPDETPDQNIPMEPALLPGLQEPMGYPRPLKRYREKGPQDNLVDDDGQSPQPEPDDERPGEPQRDEEAKARHVMKGFSEEGAENIEATTPQ
ncbi:unnamed protein product, partial [Durusdinium trenchii]